MGPAVCNTPQTQRPCFAAEQAQRPDWKGTTDGEEDGTMKKRMGRGSVIVAWVISYVLILAVPLAINLISTVQMSNLLKEEAYGSTASLLYQAQNSIDARLDDIQRIARQIRTNSSIGRFLSDLSQMEYPADEFNRIMIDLRSYQSANSLIEQIYIIPRSSDIAVSSGAVLRGAQFDALMETYRMETEAGEADLRSVKDYGDVWLFRTRSGVSGEKTVLGYVQMLTKRAGSRYDATLLILLNRSSLILNLDIRKDLFERPLYIVNDRDELVAASSARALPETLGYAALSEQSPQFSVRLKGESYTVMQANAGHFGWKYVMLIPDSLILKEFRRTQQLLWFTTIAAITVGAAFAVYFSRRNYLPLKDLVSIMASESGQAYARKENEFFFLKKATQGLSAERQALEARLSSQMENLRRLFLTRLLKNELPENMTAREGIRLYDVPFPSERFLVMAVCRQGASAADTRPGKETAQKQKRWIRETLERNTDAGDCGFCLDMAGMQVYLVSFAKDTPEEVACGRAYAAAERSLAALETLGVQDLIVASSGYVQGVAGLPQAYLDAYMAAEYCIVMNRTGLNHHRDVAFGMADEDGFYYYYYPLQVEMQLTNAIKSGDCAQAEKVLDELFRVNFEQCAVPREIAQCFMFNLTSTIMRIIYELNLTTVDDIEQSVSAIEALLNCRSIPQIRIELDRVIAKLTDYTREQRTQNGFAAGICAYIEEKYADANLDIPMIAEHFALTPSHLSKKFKNAVGIGLLDYINQYRVKKAAAALGSTQDSIQKIAENCGFLNCNTFIRVFKKYEGVTPGRYREINGER